MRYLDTYLSHHMSNFNEKQTSCGKFLPEFSFVTARCALSQHIVHICIQLQAIHTYTYTHTNRHRSYFILQRAQVLADGQVRFDKIISAFILCCPDNGQLSLSVHPSPCCYQIYVWRVHCRQRIHTIYTFSAINTNKWHPNAFLHSTITDSLFSNTFIMFDNSTITVWWGKKSPFSSGHIDF